MIQTLESHVKNGLFDIIPPHNRIIFFQEIEDEDRQIADKFDCRWIGNSKNIGILNAMMTLIRECKTSYFVFCENDWYLCEKKERVRDILEDSVTLIEKGFADIVRLRHRQKPGMPLYSRPENTDQWLENNPLACPYKLESLSWLSDPEKIYGCILEKHELNSVWYVTSNNHQLWSNNVFLTSVSYLKAEIIPVLELYVYEKDHYGALEKIMIHENKTCIRFAGGEGLFTHQDTLLNYPEKIKQFAYHYKECQNIVLKYQAVLNNELSVVDIGSNVGYFSLAVLNNTRCRSIHLFEPCREYLEYSKTLLQGHDNVYFHQCGLGDQEKIEVLYKNRESNIGWNTFLTKDPNQRNGFTEDMDQEICSIKRLDDFDLDPVDFIKIDVEGYECEVIRGAIRTIKKFRPYLLVEIGWGNKHPYWEKCEKTYNMLFDMGYGRVEFTDHTQDVLFTPIR